MRNDTAAAFDAMDLSSTLSLTATAQRKVIGLDTEDKTSIVCSTIKACELPDDDSQRAPVDIMVALDVSGSMSGEKLALCKTTLGLLVKQLNKNDRFGLVSFGSDARIELPARKMTQQNRDLAVDKIKSMTTRGCTNMASAIMLASQEIRAIENPSAVRSIFLLTDGLANEAVADTPGLLKLTRGCLALPKGDSPITVHCFGYGSDHDDKLLSEMSQVSVGGTYYFVESDSSVAAAFGDALGGVLSVVAQSVVLNIKVPDHAKEAGVKILDVYHEQAVQVDPWNYKVTLGDFYAEESKDVLAKIKLANSELADSHVECSMSYMNTVSKSLVPTTSPKGVYIARPSGMEISDANEHVEVQWLRVYAVQEMEDAQRLSREGELEKAKAKVDASIGVVKRNKMAAHPLAAQLAADLDLVAGGLQSRSAYESYGQMHLTNNFHTHKQQRCQASSATTSNAYRSKKKTFMAMKFSK